MSKNASGEAENQQGSRPVLSGIDPSETTCRIPKMDKNLAMLLGFLFTDGCVSPKWKNSWRIYFSSKSEVLLSLFQGCIIQTFYLDVKRVLVGKTSNGFLKAVVNSKEIGNWLFTKYGRFRTLKFEDGRLPKATLPVEELVLSNCTKYFLSIAFSCDGGISFYPARHKTKHGEKKFLIRTVFLSCSHPKLRSDYVTLLKFLGIRVRNVSGDNKIKIETRENIEKFYQRIGFLDGVEVTHHSKFWRGYTKQHLLELLVSSYLNPSSIYQLPQFHLR